MIGALEIIFAAVMFCVIWFLIFKILLKVDKKKPLMNIEKKLEAQQEKIKTGELLEQIKNQKQDKDNIKPQTLDERKTKVELKEEVEDKFLEEGSKERKKFNLFKRKNDKKD